MSRPAEIVMSAAEQAAFLEEQGLLTLATNGPDGWPHVVPLNYVLRDGRPWTWTYAKSQKVRNLERDDRATVQVEAGRAYHELRGVMLRCRTRIHAVPEVVTEFGLTLMARHGNLDVGELDADVRAVVRHQAPKRVALEFVTVGSTSWDHRKLDDRNPPG